MNLKKMVIAGVLSLSVLAPVAAVVAASPASATSGKYTLAATVVPASSQTCTAGVTIKDRLLGEYLGVRASSGNDVALAGGMPAWTLCARRLGGNRQVYTLQAPSGKYVTELASGHLAATAATPTASTDFTVACAPSGDIVRMKATGDYVVTNETGLVSATAVNHDWTYNLSGIACP